MRIALLQVAIPLNNPNMTFYDRYINGQREQVHQDILELDQEAFAPKYFFDVENVLTETFQRVAYNLDIISSELKNIGYVFQTNQDFNYQPPISKPLKNATKLLIELDKAVQPFGFVPLSLKIFYSLVGACNFGWDYETNENYIWRFADPIQIFSLDNVVSEVTDEELISDFQECFKNDGFISLQLSADYLHKDNTSGGPAYSLKLTKDKSVDSEFLNEEHNTTFINYLRICFDNCGFSRIRNPENNNEYQEFFNKVKPLLKPI